MVFVVVGSLETSSKWLAYDMALLNFILLVKTIPKTAILETVQILRKVMEAERSFVVPRL